jgi:beta-glucosidase
MTFLKTKPMRCYFFSVLVILFFLTGCALHPLGPLDKAPRHQAAKNSGYHPFAWGISTSSLQYEDRSKKSGTKEYFERDWDILVQDKKAPPVGNALYSWSHFDKDLKALKKIGVNSYRFSIEWARVDLVRGSTMRKQFIAMLRWHGSSRKLGLSPTSVSGILRFLLGWWTKKMVQIQIG